MPRSVLALAVAAALFIALFGPRALERDAFASTRDDACIPREKCCRICDAGLACGNTCISAKKQCRKGRGCACNESEICSSG